VLCNRVFPLSFCLLSILLCARIAVSAHGTGPESGVARPNVLWITSEDNASHWLGCYGNTDAQTPRLDALAVDSVLFTHAYSNAPVCAVARSTILHGIYSVSSGTQHMRSRHPISASFKPYVSYLRELGYYCTNNSKTDYNRLGNDKKIWHASSQKAHYKNRKEGQPFFAIFNLTVSHESSLFPESVAANRKQGIIPNETRLSVDQLQIPPYLPDLPEVRSDFAIYHDTITALDKQVADILDELEDRGLAEDTIVFYYADHGGPTPRGKRYLTDTGVRVPMIVHMPKKWQHFSPFQPGESIDELVSFVDLAPTLLSICGQEKPTQMQGRAFLGSHRVEPAREPVVFLFADRFDGIYDMRRGITDGRFKYIRRFTSHLPAAPYSDYSLSVPSWRAWQQAWQDDRLTDAYRMIWEAPQPVEELYDLEADPWEVRNLADDPGQRDRLADFRDRLREEMAAVYDSGVIPEPMFRELAGESTISEYVRSEEFDLDRVLRLAFVASAGDPASLPVITTMLTDEDSVVRYWGALGCVILGDAANELAPQIVSLGSDAHPSVRMTAALARSRMGRAEEGKAALLRELDAPLNSEASILLANLVIQLDCADEIPRSWIKKHLNNKNTNEYLRRFVQRLDDAPRP